MKFIEKNKHQIPRVGDIIILETVNEPRIIVRDRNMYSLIDPKDGAITLSWYDSISDLLAGIDIKRVIPREQLELREI